MDAERKLELAKWVLERNLAWIAAAEAKVGAIVAINTAMLAGLGTAFSLSDVASRTLWARVLTVSASAALVLGLFCAAMAVLPRVSGPPKSLLFFGRIGTMNEPDYIDGFQQASVAEHLADWTAQIHRNAKIACAKFNWVRNAMWWSFLSLLPWFPAIVLLLDRGRIEG